MTKRTFIALIAAVVALAAVSALAQANTGDVKGKVLDDKGRPLASGTIRLTGPDATKTELKVKDGEFLKTGLPAGRYKVELVIARELRWQGEGDVVAGKTTQMDIDLAAGAALAKLSPEEQKKIQEAEEEKRKKYEAEKAKVKNLNAMLAQGKEMVDAGNFDGAIGVYESAAKLDPTRDLLWANLGSAYLAKGAKATDKSESTKLGAQAAEAFQKAIAVKPNDARYHNNLGQAYVFQGKTGDALKEYTQAAQLDPPGAAMFYFNAAAILTNESTKATPGSVEQKQKINDANELFRKSAAADPNYNNGEAYYQLATNLLSQATMSKDNKMVVPEGTTEAYQKYLEISPSGRYAESAKQTLAALGSTVETSYKKTGTKKK